MRAGFLLFFAAFFLPPFLAALRAPPGFLPPPPPDDLRAMIRQVRALTDRPFGVNLWLHSDLRPTLDPATIPDETLHGAQAMLNQFRERLGIPPTTARPARGPNLVDAALEVVLEERPPVFSAASCAARTILSWPVRGDVRRRAAYCS